MPCSSHQIFVYPRTSRLGSRRFLGDTVWILLTELLEGNLQSGGVIHQLPVATGVIAKGSVGVGGSDSPRQGS